MSESIPCSVGKSGVREASVDITYASVGSKRGRDGGEKTRSTIRCVVCGYPVPERTVPEHVASPGHAASIRTAQKKYDDDGIALEYAVGKGIVETSLVHYTTGDDEALVYLTNVLAALREGPKPFTDWVRKSLTSTDAADSPLHQEAILREAFAVLLQGWNWGTIQDECFLHRDLATGSMYMRGSIVGVNLRDWLEEVPDAP